MQLRGLCACGDVPELGGLCAEGITTKQLLVSTISEEVRGVMRGLASRAGKQVARSHQ